MSVAIPTATVADVNPGTPPAGGRCGLTAYQVRASLPARPDQVQHCAAVLLRHGVEAARLALRREAAQPGRWWLKLVTRPCHRAALVEALAALTEGASAVIAPLATSTQHPPPDRVGP